MKYVILCGGRGERFISANPKPVNRVCGKMVGEWMIHSLLQNNNINELTWILNPRLYNFSIEDEIKRWTGRNIINTFVKLPFETRDPSETLEIGLQSLDFNDSFICLDNDNIYIDGFQEFNYIVDAEAAILISMMKPDIEYKPQYGFVKVENGIIIEGREKIMNWGENAYSCGGYWFQSLKTCRQWLKNQRHKDKRDGECSLLTLIMNNSQRTQGIITNKWFSIGTPYDCALAEMTQSEFFGWNHSRIVVDLDNTLVSYPKIAGDYLTVVPHDNVVDWIRDKSNKGAEIIVSTARRMQTHNGNIGKVTSDIGIETLSTIKNLQLNESEINLGKPIGDIYIDDRAINPYDNHWTIKSGDWQDIASQSPINKLPTTRDVSINIKHVEHVIKSGPIKELQGQAHYYNFLNNTSLGRSIRDIFPRCYDIIESQDSITLDLEYIKGVPASYLWSYNTWSESEWKLCVDSLNRLHKLKCQPNINTSDIIGGYIDKVERRRKQYKNYELVDPNGRLWNILSDQIKDYVPEIITHIHGDSFMGNIIFPMKGYIKFIDMRGEINNILTVYGDPNYDWAKLATSFLGMDAIVYNLPMRSFEDGMKWIQRLPNYEIIIKLALVLMYGTLFTYNSDVSAKIIKRIQDILNI